MRTLVTIFRIDNTTTKDYYKAMVERIQNNWPGALYLVFNICLNIPGESIKIAIGYKYNSTKLIRFIDTEE